MDNDTSVQAQERREKPLNDLLTSTMVNIYVGSENTHWYIHERLLCYYSPFFADIFYADDKNPEKQKAQRNKAYGLEDEDDLAFEMFVGWLYSRGIKVPKEEKDVGPLLDLYLLSERLRVDKLSTEVVEAVSDFYYHSRTYPSLRRVQHIYANTDEDNEMREMMVGAVAKLLTTSEKIPAHWAAALQRNGQLAVDIIRSIQHWKIEENSIPDARDRSSSRGRSAKNGFSAVERTNTDSMDTTKTGATSNLGVESLNSDTDQDHNMQDSQALKSEQSEATQKFTSPPPNYSALSSPAPELSPAKFTTTNVDSSAYSNLNSDNQAMGIAAQRKRPPDHISPYNSHSSLSNPASGNRIRKRRLSVTFADEVQYTGVPDEKNYDSKHQMWTFFPPPLATSPQSILPPDFSTEVQGLGLAVASEDIAKQGENIDEDIKVAEKNPEPVEAEAQKKQLLHATARKPETIMLGFLWMLYLSWLARSQA